MNISQSIHPHTHQGNTLFKPVVLLAICIFLLSAPAPDASVIEEITSNIIVVGNF